MSSRISLRFMREIATPYLSALLITGHNTYIRNTSTKVPSINSVTTMKVRSGRFRVAIRARSQTVTNSRGVGVSTS